MSTRTQMPFWDHVVELRNRILVVLVCTLVFSVVGYLVFPWFFRQIAEVLGEDLYATKITEGFATRLRVAVLIGSIASIPMFLFELVLFVVPALTGREKTFMLLSLLATFALFVFGVAFAYRAVLPASITFLKSREFFPDSVGRLVSYGTFITFFFQFLLGFGLCFEFPVVIVLLLKLGVVRVRMLVAWFKYFVIAAFAVSAVITPTPDVVTQSMLALPMVGLYGLCIVVGWVFRLGVD